MKLLKRLLRALFPPPCPQVCGKKLNRFHLTCLTCWQRHEYFKTKKARNLKRYKKVAVILESPSGKGVLLPKSYAAYMLIIDRNSHFYWFKRYFLKVWLTIAERIAEW